jgi:hypothetical protein
MFKLFYLIIVFVILILGLFVVGLFQNNPANVFYSLCIIPKDHLNENNHEYQKLGDLCGTYYSKNDNRTVQFSNDIILKDSIYTVKDDINELVMFLSVNGVSGSDSMNIPLGKIKVNKDGESLNAKNFFPFEIMLDEEKVNFELLFKFPLVRSIAERKMYGFSENYNLTFERISNEEFDQKRQDILDEKDLMVQMEEEKQLQKEKEEKIQNIFIVE